MIFAAQDGQPSVVFGLFIAPSFAAAQKAPHDNQRMACTPQRSAWRAALRTTCKGNAAGFPLDAAELLHEQP